MLLILLNASQLAVLSHANRNDHVRPDPNASSFVLRDPFKKVLHVSAEFLTRIIRVVVTMMLPPSRITTQLLPKEFVPSDFWKHSCLSARAKRNSLFTRDISFEV